MSKPAEQKSTEEQNAGTAAPNESAETPPNDGTPETPPVEEGDPEGAEHLGDPGKKALAAMKEREKAARTEARETKQALEELRAEIDRMKATAEGREKEFEADQARKQIESEALAKANDRIKRAEIRAAATAKLADPEDAHRFLSNEIAALEVNDDGDVDRDAINSLIDDLITRKPYLAAQGGRRFEGTPDGGARTPTPPKSVDDQIREAEASGNWDLARSLKAQRLLLLSREQK